MSAPPRLVRPLTAVLLWAAVSAPAPARLAEELGRSEVRVLSAPFELPVGATVTGAALPERLARLGYRRVHRRPESAGEYFWGHETFWIYRRAHRWGGRERPAELLRLELERGAGRIRAVESAAGGRADGAWLEPELLSESLAGDRAPRRPVRLSELPEHVWRAVLAVEDARFFEHSGVDPRAVARALWRNARAGRVTQGGSTITQQLVKLRDLSPKRTLGRKVSEAVRALAVEAEYDKEEILEAYLDAVYFGHLGGVGVYGYGAGARAWFSKRASDLDLAEASLLAGMIQGPNRLHPVRHPERALARQRKVLERLAELGWISQEERRRAAAALPRIRLRPPTAPAGRHFLAWIRDEVERKAPGRLEPGRGVVAETTLDPWLQEQAERSLGAGLAALRRRHRSLRGRPLAAALVALDGASGRVLALVGGDPADRSDRFDRARRARRQPGSAVKPLVLLEAFQGCGRQAALHPASRVEDAPLRLDVPGGPWEPQNFDGRFRGAVDLRRALVESLNVPFVRVARWCGLGATAATFRRAGLELPEQPPPAFALGAVETTPVELAAAYTVFARPGRRQRPRPVARLERPGGRRLERYPERSRRVTGPEAAWLVRDLLRDAMQRGTARPAALDGATGWGKTGTSSGSRDAWLVGGARGVVAAVWVGLDDGSSLGLSAAAAAAPMWRAFMAKAAAAAPPAPETPPSRVVRRWIDARSGLRVGGERRGARAELFRRGTEPPRKTFWRPGPAPALR